MPGGGSTYAITTPDPVWCRAHINCCPTHNNNLTPASGCGWLHQRVHLHIGIVGWFRRGIVEDTSTQTPNLRRPQNCVTVSVDVPRTVGAAGAKGRPDVITAKHPHVGCGDGGGTADAFDRVITGCHTGCHTGRNRASRCLWHVRPKLTDHCGHHGGGGLLSHLRWCHHICADVPSDSVAASGPGDMDAPPPDTPSLANTVFASCQVMGCSCAIEHSSDKRRR